MKQWFMMIMICGAMVFSNTDTMGQQNPLLTEFKTPFGVPPFNQIKEQHFIPAMEAGMQEQNRIIAEILNEPNPTFQNTFEKFESSDKLLSSVRSIFENLRSANTNPELLRIAKEMAPVLSAHYDNIYLNSELFHKLSSLGATEEVIATFAQSSSDTAFGPDVQIEKLRNSDNPDAQLKIQELEKELRNIRLKATQLAGQAHIENLPIIEKRLANETLKRFVRAGANLNDSDKDRLKEINSELAVLSVQFGENVLGDVNEYKLVITEKDDLAGLPKTVVDAAKQTANNEKIKGWVFTLTPTSMGPFLKYAENRNLRQQIMEAHLSKGNMHSDRMNGPIIQDIVQLRDEKARLMNYSSHAQFILAENMAGTPNRVMDFLNQIWTPALKMVEEEAMAIQKMIDKEGHDFKLEPWDWAYYTEKIRKEKYDLDAEELRPYFELEQVKKGMFDVIDKLWGVKFKELKNLPSYHQDVQAYEVTESNGNHIGVIYMDFFPRASKRGGAWMSSFRKQYYENGKRVAPVVTIVCNFTEPTKKEPSLLTLREVETLYHEMGHALHGLLSDVKYNMLSGTAVSRDFVELPSQIMENWATERSQLQKYAKHYKTNAPIPSALLDKIEATNLFNMGFTSVEYLAASFLDMRFHSEATSVGAKPEMVEFMVSARHKVPEYIPFRYKSTYFNHIFSGGYSAGYYSYIWSEVLDADAFAAFKESGDIFNKQLAKKFRAEILEKGNTEEPDVLYRNFRGSDPKIDPLLKRRGFQK